MGDERVTTVGELIRMLSDMPADREVVIQVGYQGRSAVPLFIQDVAPATADVAGGGFHLKSPAIRTHPVVILDAS